MSSKIIKVTVTSTIYTTVEAYIKDHKSPAFPSEIKNNRDKKTTDEFDWQGYAEKFCRWQSEYSDKTEYQNNIDRDRRNYTNLQSIKESFKNYPKKIEEIDRLVNASNFLKIPLKPGIVFSIPLESVSREALLTHGIE